MPTNELSPAAQRVWAVTSALRVKIGLPLIRTLTGAADADDVLRELLHVQALIRTRDLDFDLDEPDERDVYEISITGRRDTPVVDPRPDIEQLITYAVHADRAQHPYDLRLANTVQPGSENPFADVQQARDWATAHHDVLLSALDLLMDHQWHDLVLALAEALWGLAQGHGDQEVPIYTQQQALEALELLQAVAPDETNSERCRELTLAAVTVHARLALSYADVGDHDEAINSANRAEDLASAHQDAAGMSFALRARATTLIAADDAVPALGLLAGAVALDNVTGNAHSLACGHRLMGQAYIALGRLDEASAELTVAEELFDSTGDRTERGRTLLLLGDAEVLARRAVHALNHLHAARVLLEETGVPLYLAELFVALGKAAHATDDHSQGSAFLRTAASHYRDAGRVELARKFETYTQER